MRQAVRRETWLVLATFLAFCTSVGVYLAAPTLFPPGHDSVESTRTPLPAGPRKYQ
jgi:hypothetical protein